MQKILDKDVPHEEKPKTGKLTEVKGYVAPTDTGTIRTVRPHSKLVEVDVKEPGQDKQAQPNEIKINGVQTVNEAVGQLQNLNQAARESDFGKSTDKLVQKTVGFYRGGVNTSESPRLNEKDGLRNVFDEMSMSLHDIGFNNQYNLSSQQAIVKLTSPEYTRTLASKTSMVERRLNDLGLQPERLDPFTVRMRDSEGKDIYVSNNPLDIMTADKLEGKINSTNGNVLTALHQDRMNDFVFYTADNIKGGSKQSAAVATYDTKSKNFTHYTDKVHPDISPTLEGKLKSKKSEPYHGKDVGEIEQWEIRAMMTAKLQSMQGDIEQQVKGNGNEVARLIALGDGVVDKNAAKIKEKNGSVIAQAMSEVNGNFVKEANQMTPRSLATGSPLNQQMNLFQKKMDEVISGIQSAIEEFAPTWKKFKSGVNKK